MPDRDDAPAPVAPPEAAPADPRIGEIVAERYRLRTRIGRGGMGAIYEGEHLTTGKRFAVKTLLPGLGKVPDIARRFEREARAASALSHPNVVSVVDFGALDDGSLFLVMELVRGRSLGEVIGNEHIPVPRALAIVRQVLEALAHAHANSVVHRDLKPDNVMLLDAGDSEEERDLVKLLDFGIAKVIDGPEAGEQLTQAGIAFGTPDYMAPEQALGDVVDGRADLYAMGVILFELLAGRKPFVNVDKLAVLRMHVAVPAPRVVDVAPDRVIAPELEGLIARALEKRRDERFATAVEMIQALDVAAAAQAGHDLELAGRIARATAEGLAAVSPPGPGVGARAPASASGARPSGEQAAPSIRPSGEQASALPRPSGEHAAAPFRPSGEHAAPFRPSGEHAAAPVRPSGEHAAAPFRPSGEHAAAPFRPSGEHAAPFHPSGEHAAAPFRPSGEHAAPPVRPSGEHAAPFHPSGEHAAPSLPSVASGSPVSPGSPALARPSVARLFGVGRRVGGAAWRGLVAITPPRFRAALPAAVALLLLGLAIFVATRRGEGPSTGPGLVPLAPFAATVVPKSERAVRAEKLLASNEPSAAEKLLEDELVGPEGEADPHGHLILGHARAELGKHVEALVAYERALTLHPALAGDEALVRNVGKMIERRDRRIAFAALLFARDRLGGPGHRLIVAQASTGKDRNVRERARELVDELGLAPEVDLVESYSLDLHQGSSCRERREAIPRLRALGDKRAIPALRRARDRSGGFLGLSNVNSCLERDAAEAIEYLESLQ